MFVFKSLKNEPSFESQKGLFDGLNLLTKLVFNSIQFYLCNISLFGFIPFGHTLRAQKTVHMLSCIQLYTGKGRKKEPRQDESTEQDNMWVMGEPSSACM